MSYPQGAARMPALSGADSAALQQHEHGAAGACAHADRLIRDYFSRGSQESSEDAGEDALSRLLDDMEAAVARVATVRAMTLNEIAHKRALQDALRPHRDLLADHLANVGKSIDRDLHRLLASEPRSHAVGQGGWLGWALQSWKGPRPVEAVARETEQLNV